MLQNLILEHLETFKELLTNVDNDIYLIYVWTVSEVCPLLTVILEADVVNSILEPPW